MSASSLRYKVSGSGEGGMGGGSMGDCVWSVGCGGQVVQG